MKTLFGKIFLWFFGAQVLIGAVLFVIAYSQSNNSIPLPAQEMLTEQLRWRTRSAALLAHSHQLDALAAMTRDTASDLKTQRHADKTIIFQVSNDGKLKPVGSSAGMTPTFYALAERAVKSPGFQLLQTDSTWGGALAAPIEGGGLIVVVQQMPRFPRHWGGFWDDIQAPGGITRAGVVLCLMALVCYGLARYLTAPVARLRTATQRLAEGDLSTRVAFGERGGDELISLGRDFDRMAARLEGSLEAERRLLGDISHELRSPLARLSVALDLVEQWRARAQSEGKTLPESSYLNALERIRRESGRLNDMIGQLLELTRLESLASESEIANSGETVALHEVLADVVADAQYEARTRACQVELLENEPYTLRAIEPLLHSAIENVVRNAVRYTGESTNVEVGLHRGSDGAVLRVRDHGPGVPEDTLQSLFRPFYRVATGRDRQSGGVGLGLAIAQRAMRVHGATIEARNAEGGGLEVEIRFPKVESSALNDVAVVGVVGV